jgi:lipopolysaccharide assembly protein A
MKTQGSLIAALLFSLLIAVFAIVNNEVVTVNYLFGTVEASLVLLILGSAAAGAAIMVLLSLVRHVRVGFEVRDLKKKIKHLEEQLKARTDELKARTDELKAREALPAAGEGEAPPAEKRTEEEQVDCAKDVGL